MRLAIAVGFLADMKENDEEGYEWAQHMLANVNRALSAERLPTWEEPEAVEVTLRPHADSFPYSFIHFLRRAYVLALAAPSDLPPTNGQLTSEDHERMEDESAMLASHLLCHSDAEGVYVPVDLAEPVFASPDSGVPGGGLIGSSQGLLRELRIVAPYLGVTLDPDLSDAEAARLDALGWDEENPFHREHTVFLALWEAARVSVAEGTAIVFT